MSERIVFFRPAFHRCTDPAGNFGIGSVHMWFVLKHEGWAITWDLFTGWGLPTEAFHAASPLCTHPRHQGDWPSAGASGGAVTWHSPMPLFWEQSPQTLKCDWIDAPCCTDSGYLLGSELFDVLRIEGDEAVWSRLETLLIERRDEAVREGVPS